MHNDAKDSPWQMEDDIIFDASLFHFQNQPNHQIIAIESWNLKIYIYIYAIQISWGGASSPSQCCWQKVQTSPFAQSQSFQKKERFGRKHEVKVYYDSTKQECPLGIEFNAFGGYRHREIAESNCCKKRNLTQPSATFWGMVIDQTKSSKATSRTLTCPHRFGIPSGPCTCSLSCCVHGLLPTIR